MNALIPGEPEALATGARMIKLLRALTLAARLFVVIFFIAISSASAGTVTNFADIEFWVGMGTNQAALVIDWNGQSAADNSLVWGYRWDGSAKGIDMITAIVAADNRLYAKMGPIGGFGFAIVGLGYDANDDGQFALSDDTAFDEYGISNEVPSDFAVALNGDWYAEGWSFSGLFWNYGVASSSPFDGGTWTRSGSGVSGRNLANGSWDSLAISPINTQTYAQNPLAAQPTGNADFDDDGDVDGRDFLAWQRGESPNPLSATDLAFWSEQYGTNTFSSITSDALEGVTHAVPEPSPLICLCLTVGAWSVGFTRFRFASWRMNS